MDDGFFTKIFLQINPKKSKKQFQQSETWGKKEKHWSSCSLDLNVDLSCADMHTSKICLWQFTNPKQSKKSTVQRESQTLLLLLLPFSLLQKVIRNMQADAKIESWIFHHLVEQPMQDEVFTGSTCSNSPACCNAGTPCRTWPITLLQVKSPLC